MRRLSLIFSCLVTVGLFAQDRVIITGLLDGTAPGATPRAVELYVQGTVDLSTYTIVRYANANTEGQAIGLEGTYTDAFVYVVNGTEEFAEAFGVAGDFNNLIASGTISGNGNDAFTLEREGTIIDQVGGDIGDDTSIYQDTYLYRNDGTGPDGGWVPGNWNTPDEDLLDNLTLPEIGAAVPFGTYTVGAISRSITVTGTPLAEPDSAGGFTITLSEAADTAISLTYALSGTADLAIDYLEIGGGGNDTIAAGELSTRVTLDVINDATIEGTETIVLTILSVSDSTYALPQSFTIPLLDDDLGTDPISIGIVQGRGPLSPLVDDTVTVQAIVVGDFQEGLRGFYLQEEAADVDGDSLTSEGIFVFAQTPEVSVGDLVTVRAPVSEFSGQTQLLGGAAGASISVDSSGLALPAAVPLTLPLNDTLLEALEGMRVTPQNFVITDVSDLDRFGSVEVTPRQRLIQFTECNVPDSAGLAAYRDSIADELLLIDDGRNSTNDSIILFAGTDTLTASSQVRAGQAIAGLTGILGEGFGAYRIQPTDTEGLTLSGNERPTAAPDIGGEVTVVSANVLNYFTTLDSRGADTEAELRRQEDKIVAALCELEADILGLIEIENDSNAIRRLVDTLSARCGVPYAYVRNPNPGDDHIMVALAYRTDRIAESGAAAALATPDSVFVGRNTNRVPLAQTFRVIDSTSTNFGEELTVAVNHFKSKGGGCGSGDDDPDGGAGNCNGTRAAAARALTDWLATNPTGATTPNVLVIGDLNAYRMEEPIMIIEEAGYVNTKTIGGNDRFPCGGGPPSYVFGGQWGSLDYALASDSLARFVTGATAWTVNAPEPDVLDYNTEGASEGLYAPDFYRFSDHDPIVVGLDLSMIINSVRNSVPRGSGVELVRTGPHTYTFDGMQREGAFLLVNSTGQLVRQGRATVRGTQVDAAGLVPGIYLVVLREPGAGRAAFKIVVHQ